MMRSWSLEFISCIQSFVEIRRAKKSSSHLKKKMAAKKKKMAAKNPDMSKMDLIKELKILAKEHKDLRESKTKTEESKKRRKALAIKMSKIKLKLPENIVLPPLPQAIPKSDAERQARARAMKSNNKEANMCITLLKKRHLNSLRNWDQVILPALFLITTFISFL